MCSSEDYIYLHSQQMCLHFYLTFAYWNLNSSPHRCILNPLKFFFPLICNLTSSATVQRMPRTSRPLSEISIRTAGEAHHVSLRTWCCQNAGTTGKHLYSYLFLSFMDQQDVRRIICLFFYYLTVYNIVLKHAAIAHD